MRTEDMKAINELLSIAYKSYKPKNVIIFSPSSEEVDLVRTFFGIEPLLVGESTWNLNSCKWMPADLAIACNVFMSSPDPEKWLSNIYSGGINKILIQDNVRAKRSPDRELGIDTGDIMRYSLSKFGMFGHTDPGHQVFDLSSSKFQVENVIFYKSDRDDDQLWIKFLAMVKLHG